MNTINFAKELEKITASLTDRQKLLLHSCCAPCSSYCLIYLLPYFDITCFYYNPNITDREEYEKRLNELHRLVDILNRENEGKPGITPIDVINGPHDADMFISQVKAGGLAECPEGGERCNMCFTMRLRKTYETALAGGYDWFTTTLTISPLKDAKLINLIGESLASGVSSDGPVWLPSDFKKNDGFKQSVELSRKYDLYRQDYCGCIYSKNAL